jgi:glutamate synthase (NADPH/NADH) small chain
VIGSGPSGLAVAWELARRGFRVRIYERDDRPGGLLMYGIPNMKLPKEIVERRVRLMEQSGIELICNTDATGIADAIARESDAVVLCIGSRTPRRVDVPGAELEGVHYALDYLSESTKALLEHREPAITAQGKDVAVIGGGDTGVDCVATALRQGARSVRQIVRSGRPPAEGDAHAAWPGPLHVFSQAYGQVEAESLMGEDPRVWSTETIGFIDGGSGSVAAVKAKALPNGDAYEIPADLVIIAKGFTGPDQAVLNAFDGFENVYVAGDARLGSSLVSIAMADALKAADQIDKAVS